MAIPPARAASGRFPPRYDNDPAEMYPEAVSMAIPACNRRHGTRYARCTG
jgi:hypothetical protein